MPKKDTAPKPKPTLADLVDGGVLENGHCGRVVYFLLDRVDATTDEIQQALGLTLQATIATVAQLRRSGWLDATEKKRRTRTGGMGPVFTFGAKGVRLRATLPR